MPGSIPEEMSAKVKSLRLITVPGNFITNETKSLEALGFSGPTTEIIIINKTHNDIVININNFKNIIISKGCVKTISGIFIQDWESPGIKYYFDDFKVNEGDTVEVLYFHVK